MAPTSDGGDGRRRRTHRGWWIALAVVIVAGGGATWAVVTVVRVDRAARGIFGEGVAGLAADGVRTTVRAGVQGRALTARVQAAARRAGYPDFATWSRRDHAAAIAAYERIARRVYGPVGGWDGGTGAGPATLAPHPG